MLNHEEDHDSFLITLLLIWGVLPFNGLLALIFMLLNFWQNLWIKRPEAFDYCNVRFFSDFPSIQLLHILIEKSLLMRLLIIFSIKYRLTLKTRLSSRSAWIFFLLRQECLKKWKKLIAIFDIWNLHNMAFLSL